MNYTQYIQWSKNIFLVDMTRERTRPFSELVTKWITKYLKDGKNILIINNKKWRSSWVMCHDCGHIPYCTQCDIAIAWHKDQHDKMFGICHICKAHYTLDVQCPECQSYEIQLYGMGNQQLVDHIRQEFSITPLLIQAEIANSPNKIKKLIATIKTNTPQIIIGTSLLTSMSDSWKPDMVIAVSADLWLHSPHFAASRHNFCFLSDIITQHSCEQFLLQSYNTEHRSIHLACKGDTETMQSETLAVRKKQKYPPITQMCTLMYKHEIEDNLYTSTHKLYQELLYLREQYEMDDLEIYATPPMIYKMYGKYRYHIILKGSDLRQYMDIAYSKLKIYSRWFKVDWEPNGV